MYEGILGCGPDAARQTRHPRLNDSVGQETSEIFFYAKKLFQNRMAQSWQKQDAFFYQHRWPGIWNGRSYPDRLMDV